MRKTGIRQGWRSKYLLKNKSYVKNTVKEKKMILLNYATEKYPDKKFQVYIYSYRVRQRSHIWFLLKVKTEEGYKEIAAYAFNEINKETLINDTRI